MKQFLRLSDNHWPITELDLDPACVIPSPNFKPNETEYVLPRQTAPEIDEATQAAIEIHPRLINGLWTQQWKVVAVFNQQVASDSVPMRLH